MDNVNFSYNWNNKLAGTCFTTLRLKDDKRFKVGFVYMISLKNQLLFPAEIVEIRHIRLDQINEFIAGVDTGYSAHECREMIKTMYKKRVTDWNTRLLSFILFRKIDHRKKQQKMEVAAMDRL